MLVFVSTVHHLVTNGSGGFGHANVNQCYGSGKSPSNDNVMETIKARFDQWRVKEYFIFNQ